MKKILLLIAFVACAALAKAQTSIYKPFKFDIGLGYAIPPGDNNGGAKAGVTFTLEPHYRLSDNLAVGLRIDVAGLGYEQKDETNSDNSNVNVNVLTSYCPTIEYYLSNGTFRPLIGGGVGLFTQQNVLYNSQTDSNGQYTSGGTRFGAFPRVGFEVGHFRLTAEYDIAGNNSNFVAFKIGAFFGGGKR